MGTVRWAKPTSSVLRFHLIATNTPQHLRSKPCRTLCTVDQHLATAFSFANYCSCCGASILCSRPSLCSVCNPHSFERRVYSDNRNYRIRENRSYSDAAADNQGNDSPAENNLSVAALPSLSEDSSVEKEFGKQDSSPKTTEDDSFQTAAETPAATPTEKMLCKKAQSVAASPYSSTTESDEDGPRIVERVQHFASQRSRQCLWHHHGSGCASSLMMQ